MMIMIIRKPRRNICRHSRGMSTFKRSSRKIFKKKSPASITGRFKGVPGISSRFKEVSGGFGRYREVSGDSGGFRSASGALPRVLEAFHGISEALQGAPEDSQGIPGEPGRLMSISRGQRGTSWVFKGIPEGFRGYQEVSRAFRGPQGVPGGLKDVRGSHGVSGESH